jgi:hypothetical protein
VLKLEIAKREEDPRLDTEIETSLRSADLSATVAEAKRS